MREEKVSKNSVSLVWRCDAFEDCKRDLKTSVTKIYWIFEYWIVIVSANSKIDIQMFPKSLFKIYFQLKVQALLDEISAYNVCNVNMFPS